MKRKNKTAAIVTVHHAPDMTQKGRRAIAKWLREQADFIDKYGTEFSNRFTARYIHR